MTWNIEHFSQHGNTISTVISIIKDINPSIIAFQEIENIAGFDSIYNNIENYDGYRASSASYGLNLAYIWDTTIVKNAQFHEILTVQSNFFPRAPLVMKCNINNLKITKISESLKFKNLINLNYLN